MTLKNKKEICLMSIKPTFFEKISSGIKKVEYRKVCPKEQSHVLLYVSSPIKKICGIIEVDRIVSGDKESVWNLTKNISGISEKDFLSYVGGKSVVYAIYIRCFFPISEIAPAEIIEDFTPPQNYLFLENEKLSDMVRNTI